VVRSCKCKTRQCTWYVHAPGATITYNWTNFSFGQYSNWVNVFEPGTGQVTIFQSVTPQYWGVTNCLFGQLVYISYGDSDKPPTDGWQETGHMPDHQVTASVPMIVWL
jgi:hypothetical protein